MPCIEQFQHIFVALAILAAGHIGVRQLVHDHRVRMAGEDRVDVHLFQLDAAIGNHAQRNDFEIANLVGGLLAAVCLDEADHDVDALLALEEGIVEHVIGLANAGGRAEIDAKPGGFC